jgi:hypothetical protein
MAQMTWRASEELLEQVRRQAKERGRSLNEWVTEVLTAVTDPRTAGTEADQVRERLAAAGLLEPVLARPRRAVDPKHLAAARKAAGRGTPMSDLVADSRR